MTDSTRRDASWGKVMMAKLTMTKLFSAACVMALSLLPSQVTRANTVDIVHDGFGAYDVGAIWGAGEYGSLANTGLYMVNKTSDTGIGDRWHNGAMPAFCMEIQEPAPTATYTYDVVMPDDVYNSVTGGTIGVTKANYLRELWGRYYDPAWATGSFTSQQDAAAGAFAAAIWEIIYEDVPGSPMQWDVSTAGVSGFRADYLDAATANKWLHSLTGSGPKADLLAFVHNGQQNYLVAVPEPATILLLGLGSLCGFAGRKRRDRVSCRTGRISHSGMVGESV